jgi:hypothetical protein
MRQSAYAYLRVSSKGQIDGHGFDRQLGVIHQDTLTFRQRSFEVLTVHTMFFILILFISTYTHSPNMKMQEGLQPYVK